MTGTTLVLYVLVVAQLKLHIKATTLQVHSTVATIIEVL